MFKLIKERHQEIFLDLKFSMFFFFPLAFDVIDSIYISKTFSAYHQLSAHIVCKCHSCFENTFGVKQDPILTVLYAFGGECSWRVKKKIFDFSPWHIHFNVLISVPSQLTLI